MPNLTSDWVTRSWDHVDVAVVTVVGCHLRGVDGVVDAVEGEEGGEVGGVAADHQQHAQPPGGRHHPARGGPEIGTPTQLSYWTGSYKTV